MKRIIGIGLVSAALLAGCGGAANTPGTGANPTAATSGEVSPTLATGAGDAGDTLPDATAAANATSVTGADATTGDATAVATAETGSDTSTTGGDTTTGATAAATSATDSDTSTTGGDATTGTAAVPTPDASGSTSGSTSGSSGSAATVPGAYVPAGIPELGLSFQVPEGWEQVSGENAWSPAGVDVPRVGVESADLTADWKPSDFLPTGGTVVSSQQVNVAGMQAMFYTVENSDGTAETHAIMRSGATAYDFYARAETIDELRTIEPVLADIVGSVQISGA